MVPWSLFAYLLGIEFGEAFAFDFVCAFNLVMV
jgi:hypothetical protein